MINTGLFKEQQIVLTGGTLIKSSITSGAWLLTLLTDVIDRGLADDSLALLATSIVQVQHEVFLARGAVISGFSASQAVELAALAGAAFLGEDLSARFTDLEAVQFGLVEPQEIRTRGADVGPTSASLALSLTSIAHKAV